MILFDKTVFIRTGPKNIPNRPKMAQFRTLSRHALVFAAITEWRVHNCTKDHQGSHMLDADTFSFPIQNSHRTPEEKRATFRPKCYDTVDCFLIKRIVRC